METIQQNHDDNVLDKQDAGSMMDSVVDGSTHTRSTVGRMSVDDSASRRDVSLMSVVQDSLDGGENVLAASADGSNVEKAESPKETTPTRVPRPYLSIQVGDDADENLPLGSSASDNYPAPNLGGENVPQNVGEVVSPSKVGTVPVTPPLSNKSDKQWGHFTSPSSCRSNQSRGSQIDFAESNQTIILYDWDDTLCPSTYCMKTHKLGVFEPLPQALVQEMFDF